MGENHLTHEMCPCSDDRYMALCYISEMQELGVFNPFPSGYHYHIFSCSLLSKSCLPKIDISHHCKLLLCHLLSTQKSNEKSIFLPILQIGKVIHFPGSGLLTRAPALWLSCYLLPLLWKQLYIPGHSAAWHWPTMGSSQIPWLSLYNISPGCP